MTKSAIYDVDLLPSDEQVTHDSAAQLFERIHADRLRFDHDRRAWFHFEDGIWREDRKKVAFHFAREMLREMARDKDPRVRLITSNTGFADGVERFSRSAPELAVTGTAWDRDPYLLGTPRGTIDLRSGQVLHSQARDGITKSTSVTPATDIDCPLWLLFLDETTGGDSGLIRFLQQFLGYCLTGDIREHALVFGYGPGGNGKSVLVNTAAGIMGDYATTAAMDTFTASHGDRHSTDLAMLRGARLVTASETEEGRTWAEAKLKRITGGDPITARFMRCDNFSFLPTFKLLIVGNFQPVLKSADDAMRRRLNIVPFTRTPSSPDPQLEAKLRREWPGILRWMVEGCLDWQKSGLQRPRSVENATATYFAEQDALGQFLNRDCVVEPGAHTRLEPVDRLYSAWDRYARDFDEPVGSKKAFTGALARRGITGDRTSALGRIYRGVSLKGVMSDDTL